MQCIPIRFVVCICLIFVVAASIFATMNISITIPQMVQQTKATEEHPDLCSHLVYNISTSNSITNNNDSSVSDTSNNRYDWSPELQGIILGCFFWSSVIFQLPAGYAVGKFGANKLLGIAMLATAVVSILTPKVTEYSVYAFIMLRVLLGFLQSVVHPGIFVIICSWIPIHERSIAMALVHAGGASAIGAFSYASGYLMRAFTWRGMFYMPGISNVIAFLIFLLVSFKKPEHHVCLEENELQSHPGTGKQVSKPDPNQNALQEVELEEDNDEQTNEPEVKDPIPWLAMLTNKAVMAFLIHRFAKGLFMCMIASEMPTYFSSVLHIDSIRIGRIGAMPAAVALVMDVATAKVSEMLIQRKYCTRTRSRKIFSLFSGIIGPVCLILMPSFRCQRRSAIQVYYFLSGLNHISSAVDSPLPGEMTHKFHCMLYTFGSVLHSIPGFLSPMLSGIVLTRVTDQWLAWDILFYSFGGFVILTNILFLLYASSERQDFDFTEAEKQDRDRRRSLKA